MFIWECNKQDWDTLVVISLFWFIESGTSSFAIGFHVVTICLFISIWRLFLLIKQFVFQVGGDFKGVQQSADCWS